MLQRVSIQNFKSLKDVTLDLQKVNLLIGPNNSGKTNFLKALESFQLIANNRWINNDSTFFNKQTDIKATIELDFDNSRAKDPYQKIIRWYSSMSLYNTNERSGWYINPENPSIQYNPFPLHSGFVEKELGQLMIYSLDPSKIKNASAIQQTKFVNPDCSDLSSFIFNLKENYWPLFQQLQEDFTKCIPEFKRIGVPADPTDGSKLNLKFFDFNETGYWSNEVSEGVLYFIGLLSILNQPNAPKLLILEEPEKGIHPRRIQDVINFIFRLVDDKDVQVIMTTHSPIVVDEFRDLPESVFIFDKDEKGATHVKNLQKDIIEPESELSKQHNIDPPQYLNGLGEAWKVGFLGGVPR